MTEAGAPGLGADRDGAAAENSALTFRKFVRWLRAFPE